MADADCTAQPPRSRRQSAEPAWRAGWLAALLFVLAAATGAPRQDAVSQPSTRPATPRTGLILNSDAACSGYTLFAPMNSTTSYLVDMEGRLAHSWPSAYEPGASVYLLDDGSLLRAAREPANEYFGGGGLGGRVEKLAPDGTVLWTFVYADESHCQHHDIKPLPDGNVLLIAWEKKTRTAALAAGRDPELMTTDELWPDCIVEVQPEAEGGRIVWEWHVWDHLVQEFDGSKPNFGAIAEHPERIDLNYRRSVPRESTAEMRRLRSLGYVGGAEPPSPDQRGGPPPGPGGANPQADWCHTNSLDYDAQRDQIALSVHSFNEIWIIDHSTTTQEAAGSRGGRSGKGGDLLYRWGNPRAYGAGSTSDQLLFAQHDVSWIPAGCPGAGHLTVFNNGLGRSDGAYSSIVEFAPPVDAQGNYIRAAGQPYGPRQAAWEYTAPVKTAFFASHISGAQRLSNGNTLICSGEEGRIFEVRTDGTSVWEYVNPYVENSRGPGWLHRLFVPGPPPPVGLDAGPGERPRLAPPPHTGPDMRPPRAPPPGPGGPPGGAGGGLFRATRLSPAHPGIQRLLSDDTGRPTPSHAE